MSDDRVRGVLVEQLRRVAPDVDPATLDPGVDLREQMDLDSVDLANLVVALHEELGVDIPETDYRELDTIDRAVRYLSARLAPGGGGSGSALR